MGVANSKRKYSGGPNYSTKRGKDDEPVAPAEEKKKEAPPVEEDPDKIKINNMKMWGPVLKAFCDNKEVKTKIKALVKSAQQDTIAYTDDDVQTYVSGKDGNPLTEYFIDDIDKIYLFDPEYKKQLDELAKGSEDKPVRKMIAVPKENKDIFTKFIPTVLEGPKHILENVKRAVEHKEMAEIIKFVLDSKEFKDHHTQVKIEPHRADVESGKKSKEEASIENKEKVEGAAAAGEEKTGGGLEDEDEEGGEEGEEGEEDSGSIGSGSSYFSSSSYTSAGSGEGEGGGKFFKTAEEKEFKKLKKDERAGLEEKQKAFLIDTVKMIKYMDENKADIIALYKKSKLGANIDKKNTSGINQIVPKLLETIDAYVKEPDLAGAAGVPPTPPAEGAEGEKKDGAEGKPADGAEGAKPADGAKSADGAAPAGADAKPDAKPPAGADAKPAGADAKPDAKPADAKPADGEKKKGGGDDNDDLIQQGGGGSGGGSIKKKKRFTRKKPRCVNISINVGNNNVISDSDSDSSSSSSSNSSSSDSSTSDSSTSDSDDEEDQPAKKRKKKYVVNKVKRKTNSKA